ncbi:50S ribosomal protein L29 [Candidatus Babeliales bacterium]|nr:50S ribosomal protein L29 [Candidatus Babeliales bacterium]
MKKDELKSLGADDLLKELHTLRQGLFELRLKATADQVSDTSQFKKLRSQIARVLTFINQRNDG